VSPCSTTEHGHYTTTDPRRTTSTPWHSTARATGQAARVAGRDAARDLKKRELQAQIAPQKALRKNRERFVADQARRGPRALGKFRGHGVVRALESPWHP